MKLFVTLFDQCLSTSGNSDDYWHIINPETGEVCGYAGTFSVITESATDGEVLATALCASKPELREVICRNLVGRILVNDIEKV